ncbi:MAG: CoA transferase [Gammaproteobacteria bacterium]|nr:CoA transferase [Gammaproteobacteria bacterium]
MAAPLSNIRVLDMSRILAGPWAGQLLGDYGADVVKVERPGAGDDTRHWGPPWLDGKGARESAYFLSTNRNKRSITVDIANSNGQKVIRDLIGGADVLLENYKVGTLQRYGLGADELREINPRLVYCSISAFGQTGSRASDPGYDAMIQASAGLMSITGPAGEDTDGPQKVGVAIADIMAGMYAATAILAALNARELSGEGQYIDVPLYDSQVAWLANQAMNYLVGGVAPRRLGTAHPNLVPYQAFSTLDGDLMLAVGNDRQFGACVECLGQAALANDARFAGNSDRIANRDELVALLENAFRTRTTAHWLAALSDAGVPAGPINDIEKVLSNTHAEERGLVRHLTNSVGQDVPAVSNPVDFSATPVSYDRAPPLLGEHTEEVLREWVGYSGQMIAELREAAAI